MEVKNIVYTFEDVKEVYSKYITNKESLDLIERAYAFADLQHKGQIRKSGDPYITHCIGVAHILAVLQCGPKTICAGLLHDTIEDTSTTKEEIASLFGEEVANLVDALTKVTRLSDYKNVEFTAENHRKIFVAMAKDVRAIVVKLADRLHNMRTLQFQPPAKQERISKETIEVYAPIAHRLGLYKIQIEMEDLSLYYMNRQAYEEIEGKINSMAFNAKSALTELKDQLTEILSTTKIPFSISDRVKSVYSIYKKMTKKNYSFDQIYDIMALRIITQTEQNCYEILGYVHANFKPVPGRFKDYIAMPKPNMYQSLHTTILTGSAHFFEIQIRTERMDETAEGGIAAHWRYKEGSKYDPREEQKEIENQLHWFKDFVDITSEQGNNANTKEYVDTLSHDIFDANVYVFTPKGNVICLSNGSTPIDFAYRIHSDIGDHLTGARVNGNLVPISQKLSTGDVVEVITQKNAAPNSEWLNIAKTNFARSRIRKYLVKQNADFVRDDQIKKGRQTLVDALRERKINLDISKVVTKNVLDYYKCTSLEDLFVLITLKTAMPYKVLELSESVYYDGKQSEEELKKQINARKIKKNSDDAVVLDNGDSVLIALANCCTPIPGDEILGYVSSGQGVKVHRADCPNVNRSGVEERLIPVHWNPDRKVAEYPVDIAVECHDRDGLLVEMLNALAQDNAKVYKVQAKYHPNNLTTTIHMTLMCRNHESLDHYMTILHKIKSVFNIHRVNH